MIVNAVLVIAITCLFSDILNKKVLLAIPGLSILFSFIEIYQANKKGADNTKGWYFLWGTLASFPFMVMVFIVYIMASGPQC